VNLVKWCGGEVVKWMVNWRIELHGPLNQRGASLKDLQAGCDRGGSAHCITNHLTTSPIHHFTVAQMHAVRRIECL